MPESPFMGDLPNERFKIGEKPLETKEGSMNVFLVELTLLKVLNKGGSMNVFFIELTLSKVFNKGRSIHTF